MPLSSVGAIGMPANVGNPTAAGPGFRGMQRLCCGRCDPGQIAALRSKHHLACIQLKPQAHPRGSGDPGGIGPRFRGDDESLWRLLHNVVRSPPALPVRQPGRTECGRTRWPARRYAPSAGTATTATTASSAPWRAPEPRGRGNSSPASGRTESWPCNSSSASGMFGLSMKPKRRITR